MPSLWPSCSTVRGATGSTCHAGPRQQCCEEEALFLLPLPPNMPSPSLSSPPPVCDVVFPSSAKACQAVKYAHACVVFCQRLRRQGLASRTCVAHTPAADLAAPPALALLAGFCLVHDAAGLHKHTHVCM
eukprot:1159623-Pelagomonas_calceolata.AAC.12